MWFLVIIFGIASLILGGMCGAIGGLVRRGDKIDFGSIIWLLIFIVGLREFGEWLITSDALTTDKLMGIFFITFIPTGLLSFFGFAKHGA